MFNSQGNAFLPAVSRACGWLYFLAWSMSFYPQILLNYRRKTTQGFTPDFPMLNILGFSCYIISTAVFLYSPVVRSQYAARHPVSPEPTVRGNDLAFGIHALVFCVIVYSQFWPRLWRWKHTSGVRRHAHRITLGLMYGALLGVLITIAIVLAKGDGNGMDGRAWAYLDVIYAIQYVKLILTISKYVPQVIANHRRKSTIGWSIVQQLLDFSGGLLSLTQLVIDSALQADWSGLTGNPVKFGLANISMVFDITFICQHYLLYGPVEEKGPDGLASKANGVGHETDPLLPEHR